MDGITTRTMIKDYDDQPCAYPRLTNDMKKIDNVFMGDGPINYTWIS